MCRRSCGRQKKREAAICPKNSYARDDLVLPRTGPSALHEIYLACATGRVLLIFVRFCPAAFHVALRCQVADFDFTFLVFRRPRLKRKLHADNMNQLIRIAVLWCAGVTEIVVKGTQANAGRKQVTRASAYKIRNARFGRCRMCSAGRFATLTKLAKQSTRAWSERVRVCISILTAPARSSAWSSSGKGSEA